jgi:hypothetical protein
MIRIRRLIDRVFFFCWSLDHAGARTDRRWWGFPGNHGDIFLVFSACFVADARLQPSRRRVRLLAMPRLLAATPPRET